MKQEISFLLNFKNDTANILPEMNISSSPSANSAHYEVMLPVVFILLFMVGLFIIYAIRNLDLRKIITRSMTKKRKTKKPYSLVHPRQDIYNKSSIYKKPTSLQGLNYYEDQTGGFYRVQNPYILNTHPANYIIHHNYDQIYSAQTNNLILNLQACQMNNNLYQNDDYSNYNIQNVDQKLTSKNYISLNEVKNMDNLARSVEIDCHQNNEKFVYRRSYSNSKLDYHKWQRVLQKRPTYYRFDNWSSNILSEFELKKFLSQENQFLNKKPNNSSNLQVLRENCSESLLQVNMDPAKVKILNTIYNSNSSNFNNSQKENIMQSKSFDKREELTRHLAKENIYSKAELIQQKKITMSKSYSSFTNKNDYLIQYEKQIPYLNEESAEVDSYTYEKKDFGINKLANKIQTLNQINENEYSSFIFNSSEISSLAINNNNNNNNKNNKYLHFTSQMRSSTVKDSLNKSESAKFSIESSLVKFGNKLKNISTDNIFYKNICKDLRGFKNLENDYDNEPNDTLFSSSYRTAPSEKKSTKHLRLCKSFTILSNRTNDHKHVVKKEKNFSKTFHTIVQNKFKKPERMSTSEPIKLSSCSSLKRTQNNYLKSFSLIKTRGCYSINSLVDKMSNVASLTKLKDSSDTSFKPLIEKAYKNPTNNQDKYVNDAAVQTSLVISDSSSFNSHVTTLQTNFFGSILGNFGSALIQVAQTDYKSRPRAYSDGNVLSSDSNSRKNTPISNKSNQFSASSSKLSKLKYQI